MKIVLIGANGTIGSNVAAMLTKQGHEVIKVGKTSGQYQVDITKRESVRELYRKIGSFDAVANASGDVAFAPLSELGSESWALSLGSKLMGQIHLVQEAIPFIREKGSFTLVSGITADEPILAGVAATTVGRALEGFTQAAAYELPKGLRINIISPSLLTESREAYGPFFPGFPDVSGESVAQAYQKSIFGIQSGQIYRVR